LAAGACVGVGIVAGAVSDILGDANLGLGIEPWDANGAGPDTIDGTDAVWTERYDTISTSGCGASEVGIAVVTGKSLTISIVGNEPSSANLTSVCVWGVKNTVWDRLKSART
jgi:hypothetical protein